MIDIHSHVLPMVDDGSSSVDMSLEMLDNACRDGTDVIVLTPHYAYPYNFINPKEKIEPLFHDLTRIVKAVGIPIEMRLGTEFLYTKESFNKHKEEIKTLGNYMLMEFFFDIPGEDIIDAVDEVISEGLTPIIAHPERFEGIQLDLDVAQTIIQKGAYLQMNKGSILGDFGKRAQNCVMDLLDHQLINFVGSDAHNVRYRNTKMYESYQLTRYYFGEIYTQQIFDENPRKILKLGGGTL